MGKVAYSSIAIASEAKGLAAGFESISLQEMALRYSSFICASQEEYKFSNS